MNVDALNVLLERGIIEWCSNFDELQEKMCNEMVTCYVGFDPSADSLHVGNMVPLMGLAWLQKLGHQPIALAGGGTGLIGDPSGKTKERQLQTHEKIEENLAQIKKQIAHFLDFKRPDNPALLLNNNDWLKEQGFIEFLRDTGKYFPVSFLVNREYVRSRVEDPDKSITYTELSYILLQAFDFNHMYREYHCTLQMGGNDQQVNIIAGIDLIRKKSGGKGYGMTFPLLLTASGQKFGKSEEGAVYLSPTRTSPYKFYQFWINTEDDDIEKLYKIFTFFPIEEINDIVMEHKLHPERRLAQKRLAMDVTTRIHGEEIATRVQKASAILFGEIQLQEVSEDILNTLAAEIPFVESQAPLPISLVDLLVLSKGCASKGEAKRKVQEGAIYLNGERVSDLSKNIDCEDLLVGGYVQLRIGKKDFRLLKFTV